MRIIAVINQKGGVGKTTTCTNLAHALTLGGKRVVALDLDPQGHLATSFGVQTPGQGMDAVLLDGAALDAVLLPARDDLLLGPAGSRLTEVEHLTAGGADRGRRLSKALEPLAADRPDFVLIDCPPSSGLLAVNALLAADEVLVPMPGDYLALHGLSQLTRVLRSIERLRGRPQEQWVALTRFQGRRRLAREVLMKVLRYFPDRVLSTPVRETAALAEAPSFGKTIFEYRASGHGADDYRALATDLIERRTMRWPKNASETTRSPG